MKHNSIQLWDLRTNDLVRDLKFHHGGDGEYLYCTKFVNDTTILAGGSGTNSAQAINIDTGEVSVGLEIYISRQSTIGPQVLEIWWSCQISGGPDVANRKYFVVKSNTADRTYLFLYKAFEQSLQYIT